MAASLAEIVRASSLGVVAWVDRAGSPHAAGVLALTRDEVPVLALTFDRARLALALAGRGERAAAGPVALALVEGRGTAAGFRPVLVRGETVLEADPTGDVYATELREEELRRYPPARLLADSLLLCRENWWYLPRLLVGLTRPRVELLDPSAADDPPVATLVTAADRSARVSVVRAEGPLPTTGPVRLTVMAGEEPVPGPALLFQQDASFPDLERWAEWAWRGRVVGAVGDGVRLDVEAGPGHPGLPPPKRLLERWRGHRSLERACRQALEQWDAPARR